MTEQLAAKPKGIFDRTKKGTRLAPVSFLSSGDASASSPAFSAKPIPSIST